jgi:hypothetical protein
MDPLLNGVAVFGTACHVVHDPAPAASQKDGYFGVTGITALWGGGRGRSFQINGVLHGPDLPTVIALEAVLLSYADGIARVFTDTQGRTWANVIFDGEYKPNPEGPKITDFGWCLPYSCVLHGLS